MRWVTESSQFTIGGKARNLFKLREFGFTVPSFGVIPLEFFEHLEVLSELDQEKEWDALREEIMSSFTGVQYMAVRSSAVDEDGEHHSFAGQFESFLFVTKEQLLDRIRAVVASAHTERVKEYRRHVELSLKGGVAVIVQEMIDATVSGVAFGMNPVTGARKEKVISAVFGLGEGLVGGELNADLFYAANGNISVELQHKTHARRFDVREKSGTILQDLDAALAAEPTLSEAQVHEISSVLDRLFARLNGYQDIEFCYREEQLYLLQTRPVTTVSSIPAKDGEYVIWDNSNIIESYPGLTSPYTFSFISKVYEAVYRQFAQMMGVRQQVVNENQEIFANMLGLLHGRVYYNLLSWYKALALLPGYHLNAGFMEKMMGVKERFELPQTSAPVKWKERFRVVRLAVIMLVTFVRMPRLKRRFKADFQSKMDHFEQYDFTHVEPIELVRLFEDYRETLLKKWKAPLVNDFYAMVFFGVLQKLVEKYQLDEDGSIQNDLLAGANDIISTQPVHRCIAISVKIQQTEGAKAWFLESSPETIEREVGNRFPEIAALCKEYIDTFGNRCVGELKLETVSYQEDPRGFYQLIRSYVQQGVDGKAFESDQQAVIRQKAEQHIRKRLNGKPVKRWLFRYVLKHARRTVSDRENLRFERTRAFGMIRRMTLAIGHQFQAEGVLNHQRDIFFLTTDEVADFIRGKSVQENLKGLVAFRKQEYAGFEAMSTAERIPTHGLVYVGNEFKPAIQTASGLAADAFKGIGCCPGKVRAHVRVVKDPRDVDSLDGAILVTSSTDPGWVTLFPTASGILVERGSLLSHSAIVSREMGKPCIVGITGLLDILKTGDLVEMDGATGQVVRIEHAPIKSEENESE